MVDDKTPTMFDRVDKIGPDFQKTFRSKFDSIKILEKTTISVNFCLLISIQMNFFTIHSSLA